MTNRLPTILTIIASVFFLVTTFLGLTDVGGNLYYLWTDFYFIEFLKTVIIVSLVGIFLGLFLFRKWRFVERVKRTLPIAFIVFSFHESYRLIDYYYGLSEYYNARKAKEDIKQGKVQLLYAGLDLSLDSEKLRRQKDSIRSKFGPKYLNVGIHTNGIDRYNEVVESYLTEKKGKDWEKELKFKLDSVEQSGRN